MNWLIVGLGNPGKQYDNTPHNVGFAVIDLVRDAIGGSAWVINKKSNAIISTTDDNSVTLAKPQTFMNESGIAVLTLLKSRLGSNIIVIYDDLALPLGTIRIGQNESSGGHNGVQSVLDHIDRTPFIRVRVGVLPSSGQPAPAEEFITAKWKLRMNERQLLTNALDRAAEAVTNLLSQPLVAVQNGFN
jgi:PTH1 family peptidyl-tRNA hydrolase